MTETTEQHVTNEGHAVEPEARSWWRRFVAPELTPRYVLRVGAVAAAAYLWFGHVCIPCRARGTSMEPTYHDGCVNLCWRPRFWFRKPGVGDVVMVRMAGLRMMLLKRIVAVEGETVEFRDGVLFVNGSPRKEAYVQGDCSWNLPPRVVKPGHIYVVGDNRAMPMQEHRFGQTQRTRVVGGPLW